MTYLVLTIALLLLMASIFVGYQINKEATPERLNNKKRLISWWLIFGLCSLAFYLGLKTIFILICCLLIWASKELFVLLKIQQKFQYLAIGGVIVIALTLCIINIPDASRVIFILTVVSALATVFISNFNSGVSRLVFAVYWFYCCFGLFSILLIGVLADKKNLDYSYLLLFLFFIVAVNDIAQYVVGNTLGKIPITPQASPNKTLEGLLGGIVITALLFAVLLPNILVISVTQALVIGGLISVAGFLGDITISRLKRALSIKDTGTSIAGHGGLLDRIDSLILLIPVFGMLMSAGNYF